MKKAEDFRAMTDDELMTTLKNLATEMMNTRFKRSTSQIDNTAQIRLHRRAYARGLTILYERKRGIRQKNKKHESENTDVT